MLKQELGLDAEQLVGPSGQFFVEVDGERVIEKKGFTFPSEDAIVAAVKAKAQ